MRSRWADWVAFWSERERPEPLALMRMLVGLVIAWTCLSPLVFGADVLFVDLDLGGFAPVGAGPSWMDWLGGASLPMVRALLSSGVLVSLLVAAGVGGRWTPLLLGQIMLGVFSLHSGTGGGHDRLITNVCWVFFLGDANRTWSVDCRLRTGGWSDPTPVLALPRRLVVWQLVYMYTLTGLQKQGDAWGAITGWRALYDTFLLPSWARYDLRGVVGHILPLLQVGAVVCWWWETLWFLVPIQSWFRRNPPSADRWQSWIVRYDLRPMFILLGVVTHVTLLVLCNLGPFSLITMSLYVSLYDGAEWGAWLDRAGSRPLSDGSVEPPAAVV